MILGNGVSLIRNEPPHIDLDISGIDMAYLVHYWLTNSDLESPNDPRIKLVEVIKQATMVDGYNSGRIRFDVPSPAPLRTNDANPTAPGIPSPGTG